MSASAHAAQASTPRLFDRLVLTADQPPLRALARIAIGYAFGLSSLAVTDDPEGDWILYPFFLSALLALRVVPIVLRKIIPFDPSRLAVWAERRQLAKRYDSYQWQKLFWFGLGLLLHAGRSPEQFAVLQDLTILCLVAGGLGVLTWMNRVSQVASARSSVGARRSASTARGDS